MFSLSFHSLERVIICISYNRSYRRCHSITIYHIVLPFFKTVLCYNLSCLFKFVWYNKVYYAIIHGPFSLTLCFFWTFKLLLVLPGALYFAPRSTLCPCVCPHLLATWIGGGTSAALLPLFCQKWVTKIWKNFCNISMNSLKSFLYHFIHPLYYNLPYCIGLFQKLYYVIIYCVTTEQ